MEASKRTRIVIGSLIVAAVVGLFAIDWARDSRLAISSVIVLLGLGGYREFARLAAQAAPSGGSRPMRAVGFVGTVYFLGLAWLDGARSAAALPAEWLGGGLVGVLLAGAVVLIVRAKPQEEMPEYLATAVGVLLFGVLYSYVLRIYRAGDADTAILRGGVFFLGVKGTDIIAYLVGSAIGRRHFLAVSPGKTLEGSGAALLFGAAWFATAGWLWPEVFFRWAPGIPFGIILATTSALGDLAESLIKRYYRVKDSSSLLPEFGGVLDLIDSFLFSAFVFWCLVPGTS